MILFLRTKDNKTIADIEIWTEFEYDNNDEVKRKFIEISVFINIKTYSIKLIEINGKKDIDLTSAFIDDINSLNNLKEWMWESYFKNKDNVGNPNDETMIIKIIKKRLKDISDTYDLINVED